MSDYERLIFYLNYVAKEKYDATFQKLVGPISDQKSRVVMVKSDGTTLVRTIQQIKTEHTPEEVRNLLRMFEENPLPKSTLPDFATKEELDEVSRVIERARNKYSPDHIEPLKQAPKKSLFSRLRERFRPRPK